MFKKFPRLFFIANKTCDFTIKKLLKVGNKEKKYAPVDVLVVIFLPATIPKLLRLPMCLFQRMKPHL